MKEESHGGTGGKTGSRRIKGEREGAEKGRRAKRKREDVKSIKAENGHLIQHLNWKKNAVEMEDPKSRECWFGKWPYFESII